MLKVNCLLRSGKQKSRLLRYAYGDFRPVFALPCTFTANYHDSPAIRDVATKRVVVCGGGIIGCSVAYHLCLLGWQNVTVLEQGRFVSLDKQLLCWLIKDKMIKV